MDKKNKIIIALAVIGLILFCVGAFLGGSLTSLPTIFSEEVLPEGAVNEEDVKVKDVRAIEINLVNSEITIQTGTEFHLTGPGLYSTYVKDGTFYGGATEAKHNAKLFGARISAPQKWIYGHSSYTLTIPEKAQLESIKINGSYCDITGEALTVNSVELLVPSGNIHLSKIEADNVSISAKSVNVTEFQALQNAKIDASKDITLGNESVVTNVIQNLALKTTRGNVTTFGKIMGTSSISAEKGTIASTLSGASTNYTMRSLGGNLSIGTEVGAEESTENFGNISFTSKEQANVHFK